MNNTVSIQQKSKSVFDTNGLLIRQNSTYKLVLKPLIIDNNPKGKEHLIKFSFVGYRKGLKDSWQKDSDVSLSSLKKGEFGSLDFSSNEVSNIIEYLTSMREHFTSQSSQRIGKFKLVSSDLSPFIDLVKKYDSQQLSLVLENLEPESLNFLDETVKLSRLNNLLKKMSDNRLNPDEAFWQNLFEEEVWVLSQVLSQPVVVFKARPYMGGKNLEGRGGQFSDVIFQNIVSRNTGVVEIKTPMTSLFGASYRSTFGLSTEFSGAINQLLKQRQEFLNNYYSLKEKTEDFFYSINPKCFLIIGRVPNVTENKEQLFAFENFRNSLKDVEILTFDELYNKLVTLKNLLKSKI